MLLLGRGRPVKGPAANIRMLSGERGSIPLGSSVQRVYIAKPLPPIKFLAIFGSRFSISAFFLVRSTFRILLFHPLRAIYLPPRQHSFSMVR